MKSMSNITCTIGLLTVTLFTACSDFKNPIDSATAESESAELLFDYQPVFGKFYPPITDQMLTDGPAPGYSYVMSRVSALDTETDSLVKSERCRRNGQKSVKINHVVKIDVEEQRLTQDTVVTIVAPLGEALVADFYPHPLQFEDSVDITWDIKHYDFPDDFDFQTLVPLYVEDDGTVTEMPHRWENNHDKLIIRTNHFSRYIIAQRNGG